MVVAITIVVATNTYVSWPFAPSLLRVGGFTVLAIFLEQSGTRLSYGAIGSVVFIIHISVAILFGPFEGAVVASASTLVAELVSRRGFLKGAFNVAQKTLSILVAGQAYLLLGGTIPFDLQHANWLAFAALSILYFATNSILVASVIGLSSGRSIRDVWTQNSRGALGFDLLASGLALLVAWFYQAFGAIGLIGILLPVLVVRAVYDMYHRLQAQSREMLEVMVRAIEARDPYTSGHSVRVATLSRAIAQELRLPFDVVEKIYTAALLHDVGKIHEEFAPLLRKAEKLTEEEEGLLQTHPVKSADLVGVISAFRGIVQAAVRGHHERWDGEGYPDRLAGAAIPLGARIIAVADTVDAMTTDRPYRRAATGEMAIAELQRCRGSQFDPDLVDLSLRSVVVRALIAAPHGSTTAFPGTDADLPLVARSRAQGWHVVPG
jgi:hypothetical protein